MYPHQSGAMHVKHAKSGECLPISSTGDMSLHEKLFGPDGAGLRGRIVAHPLFGQLLAAHVACLRVATPKEQQHIIDSALANRDHVTAKYLALLSHLQSNSHPVENEELTGFMVNYILLLQSFKDQLHEHLHTQAVEAISVYQEIEENLFNLTGVSSFSYSLSKESSALVQEEKKYSDTNGYFDPDGLGNLGMDDFLPYSFLSYDMQKTLREHVRRKLKHELKEDYQFKLKEVHGEILRKRHASKLPEDTTHLLKDWWLSHTKWPYPTEKDKAQLMEETGLELKQINNWFINQRKRNWQGEDETNSMNIKSNRINMTLPLNIDKDSDSLQE